MLWLEFLAVLSGERRRLEVPEYRRAEETAPAPSEPPPEVDGDAERVLWFSEHRGQLVLNWRVNGTPGPGDRVALFDVPPSDPDGYVGGNFAYVSEGSQFVTDRPSGNGTYYIAYLRENDDFEFEIADVYTPGG